MNDILTIRYNDRLQALHMEENVIVICRIQETILILISLDCFIFVRYNHLYIHVY